jgi:hypothetical protein
MTVQFFKNSIKIFFLLFLLSAIISCNSNNNKERSESSKSFKGEIPDSVVQFLINSASQDFKIHQPPTAIDFRNAKIGYILSPKNEKIFVMCGEFLSKNNKEWIEFATIKTSGYEQYLGKTQYCQDATIVLTDEKLSIELKNRTIK